MQVTFPFTSKYGESILDLRLIAGEYFMPVWLGSELLKKGDGQAQLWAEEGFLKKKTILNCFSGIWHRDFGLQNLKNWL